MLEIFVDGDRMAAPTGACLHVPPGIEHACAVAVGREAAQVPRFDRPSGIERCLAELDQMNDAEFEDGVTTSELHDKHGVVNAGRAPERPGIDC